MRIIQIIWKTPVVVGALVVGSIAASQAGWSGADLAVNSQLMGMFEEFTTGVFFAGGALVCVGAFYLVQRLAKPALWLMVPVLLYAGIVLGAWDGFASEFDAARFEARKHHSANAYILQHMTPRGRFRSCKDGGIELTDDAKAVCLAVMNARPGDRIPGSEHKCGPLGMFTCFSTAPEK
jgi:hypothetical protein